LAQPVILASWSAEQVRVAEVVDELDALRRPELMPATRTSVLTLVVVASTRAAAQEAMAGVYELGGRHPARVLCLLPAPGETPPGVDAEVRLLGGEAEGHALWFEDVELVVRGEAARHLDSLIEPFTLPDLPVVVWFADEVPEIDDPLIGAADVVLVDARSFGDTDCFDLLSQLSRRVPVVDVSWHRLQPWRELLAGLFESPETRPYLRGITSVRVVGRTGPRHLLAGWIAERLDVPLAEVHVEEATHVSISLAGSSTGTPPVSPGRRATFDVSRTTDVRVGGARAAIDGGRTAEAVVPLPPATPGWGVAAALSHLDHDPVYEHALRCAIALAARHHRPH
jgi:glucose-6-phosphate dehydrogenase assembly protein OpcA